MPNEKHVYFKNKGLRDFLENVCLAWRAKFPAKAKAYDRQLLETKRALLNPSGMSKNGDLMYTSMIPTDIFYLLERKYPRFFRDPKNIKAFQDIFMGSMKPNADSKFFFQGG